MNSKTVLVLLFFVLMILAFVGGMIGNTDLTPSTIILPGENKEVVLPNGPVAPLPVVAGQSVGSGPCPSSYIVQKGDTLYRIARSCGLTLKDLVAANPAITNPNLIHVGQQINIYYPLTIVVTATVQAAPTDTAHVPAATAVPNTGSAAIPETAITTVPPTATSAPVSDQPLPLAPTTTRPPITAEAPDGLHPGGSFDIIAKSLPPSTLVQISLGKQGAPTKMVGEGVTDASGGLRADLQIPADAQPGENWVVLITSKARVGLMVISPLFKIE